MRTTAAVTTSPANRVTGPPRTVVGIFAGVGGIEKGFQQAGHHVSALCEIDPFARAVLKRRFPDAKLYEDVHSLKSLPDADLVAAGFPCQDLSQAGGMSGIRGGQSSLVGEVFRLVGGARRKPMWLLFENVPFMLSLDRGAAMTYLTKQLDSLGYTWAYRTVDTRSFGLPQRRKRVILLASQTADPKEVLFADDSGYEPEHNAGASAFGFYWTEGNNGLGWAVEAVPTLKGGSGFGIPSPPAVWVRSSNSIVTPDIRDAERLQGLPADWTAPAGEVDGARKGTRWRHVGNAVSVPLAEWVGRRLSKPDAPRGSFDKPVDRNRGWPGSAWGQNGKAFRVEVSQWPVRVDLPSLLSFLCHPLTNLSARATSGFLCRARASRLRFEEGFLEGVAAHLRKVDPKRKFPERKGTKHR